MSDEEVREQLKERLAKGLKTDAFPRADTDAIFRDILRRIGAGDGSLDSKLVIGGFTLDPVEHQGVEQACETCMYYLVRRKWCDLPELALPVEPKWSCRLWRM